MRKADGAIGLLPMPCSLPLQWPNETEESRMSMWWFPYKPRNPARDLANIGHAKRKASVRAVARQMRDELGLAPLRALEG